MQGCSDRLLILDQCFSGQLSHDSRGGQRQVFLGVVVGFSLLRQQGFAFGWRGPAGTCAAHVMNFADLHHLQRKWCLGCHDFEGHNIVYIAKIMQACTLSVVWETSSKRQFLPVVALGYFAPFCGFCGAIAKGGGVFFVPVEIGLGQGNHSLGQGSCLANSAEKHGPNCEWKYWTGFQGAWEYLSVLIEQDCFNCPWSPHSFWKVHPLAMLWALITCTKKHP